jgi:hypothetical protein
MTSKVFITQENPNLNYLPAEAFGEIHFLTRSDFSPVKNSLNNENLVAELRQKLKEYEPARDYLVISGSPVVSGVAFMLIRERTDMVNILRWSNRDQLYQHLTITIKAR